MELLSQRGHEVTVVCVERHAAARRALGHGDVSMSEAVRRGVRVRCNGVDVVAAESVRDMLSHGRTLHRRWQPDVIVVPGEDVDQRPLRAAVSWSAPVVLVCQTPATLPFGNGAAYPGRIQRSLFRRPAAILATSEFLAAYIRDAGFPALAVPLPAQPPSCLRSCDTPFEERPYVLLINPALIKGLPIFLEIAAALPQHAFAAVPAWATGQGDIRRLRRYANVSVLPSTHDVYALLRSARVLLVPSLWLENVPLVITEAMLAGVPVIASEVGGIPEVMLGTGICLPVAGVEWTADRIGRIRPRAPRQPVRPWISATALVMEDKQYWLGARATGRRAVARWLRRIDIAELEAELLKAAS